MPDRAMEVVPVERICFVFDLENLSAVARREGRLSALLDEIVAKARRTARRGVSLGGIGVGDRHLQSVSAFKLADVNVRVHARPSDDPDASDLVLIDYLTNDLPASTDTVVLGSGDHIFAPAVARLTADGRRVIVMAVPGTLSADLYRAASEYVPLDVAA